MRTSLTAVLLVVAGAIAVAGASFGEEAADASKVEATKVAPLQTIFPNSYGSVQLRHYTDWYMKDEDVLQTSPQFQVRPTLGSTFFDGKFDLSITGKFVKKPQTTNISQAAPYIIGSYTAYSGTYGGFIPTVTHYLAQKGQTDPETLIELYTYGTWSKETKAGTFSLYGHIDPYTYQHTLGNDVKVKNAAEVNAERFSLTGDETDSIEQRDPSYFTEYAFGPSYKPAGLPDLSLKLLAVATRSFKPTYVANEDKGIVEFDGYDSTNSSYMRYTVAYQINDKVWIRNDLYNFSNGVFEARKHDTVRWENLLRLNAKLF